MTGRDTRAVRIGVERSQFQETSEALFLTSGYVYDRAEDAAAAFDGSVERYTYSRFTNPTVTAFAERLADIEGAEACFPVASGMAGVFGVLVALLGQGDRVVASRNLFGSCYSVLSDILPRFGIVTDFVDGTDIEQWRVALQTPANAVFFESPSNPMQEIVDIAAVCDLAHAAGALVIADNAMASPAVQTPTGLGVDVVVYSTTKHIDGQGRTLGGAILGPADLINGPIKTFVRNTGPTMSPFTAWVALKGLETLRLRVAHASSTALAVARSLEEHPRVAWVRYPFLESHPQYDLARRQMSSGGTIVTFAIDGGRAEAFTAINALRAFDISNNFGDTKSLVTHPASTTHYRIGAEARARVGITDGTVRLSIGLEDADDLIADVTSALG